MIPDSPQPNRPSLGLPVLGTWNGQAQSIDCPLTLLNTVPKKPQPYLVRQRPPPPYSPSWPASSAQSTPSRRLSRLERFPSILRLSISPASPRLRRPIFCSPSADPSPISPRAGSQQSHSHRNPNAPHKMLCSKESCPRVYTGRRQVVAKTIDLVALRVHCMRAIPRKHFFVGVLSVRPLQRSVSWAPLSPTSSHLHCRLRKRF